jgi:tRNA pseudouridine38-40 synthase
MPTYRLTVEYDGTRYAGWQEQSNARTVAGELRRAIEEALGAAVELGGAGRTDAGVHALAQSAHLRVGARLDPGELVWQVNERLPTDIDLLRVDPVPSGFHARHDAQARSYLYQIARRRTAFAKRHVWWVRARLDTRALGAALEAATGRHDFRRFCERPESQESTIVHVERAEVAAVGDLVLIRLVASHFLWKMVRRLVGTAVQVGQGALDAAAFAALLAGDPRPADPELPSPARFTAPPSGLFLERVLYPGDLPLGPLAPVTPLASPPGRQR